jgi:hypothetical protein
MSDKNTIEATSDASIIRNSGEMDENHIGGYYDVTCLDSNGDVKWKDSIKNIVTTLGKNLVLDTVLSGSGYTVVGPFMGLISSVSYTGVPVIGDTMASHPTWYEVSDTTYFPTVAARITTNGGWNAALTGAKSLATPLSFSIITNGGTIKGCFLVTGSGAVSTLGSAGGTLYSAGLFTGGDKSLTPGDTLQVSYSASLT